MLTQNFRILCQNEGLKAFNALNPNRYSISTYPTYATHYTLNGQGWYCDVGFDDTAESYEDYKLGDSNAYDTPTLTFVSGTTINTAPAIRVTITVYKNNTENAVVVKELGMVVKTTNTASNPACNALFARTVLEHPITVPAGAAMAFTYEINMDLSESTSGS